MVSPQRNVLDLQTSPRFPLEIQELILQSIGPDDSTIDGHLSSSSSTFQMDVWNQQERCRLLSSCALVCRAWVTQCQILLFSWIVLPGSKQLDNLFHFFLLPRNHKFGKNIRRISVVYKSPRFKLGEALPRIAAINPTSLSRIDIVPEGWYAFPFHPSLPAYTSRLRNLRTLYINMLQFTHLAELRRLINSFPGIKHVILDNTLSIGEDRLGDFRPFPRKAGSNLSTVACLSAFSRKATVPLILWLSTSNAAITPCGISGLDLAVPMISAELAKFLVCLHPPTRSDRASYELWQWKFPTTNNKTCRNWSLTCLADNVTSRRFVFREDTGSSRPTFHFHHLVGIELRAPGVLNNGNEGWKEFSTVVDKLLSHQQELLSLENLSLHFSSKTTYGYHSMGVDKTRDECTSQVLYVTEPLRYSEREFELNITIDDVFIDTSLPLQ